MRIDFKHWPSKIQRLSGAGALLNVLAVHSNKPISKDMAQLWYKHTLKWMTGLDIRPQSLSFLGQKGFKDATRYPFQSANKKIIKNGFKDVHHISIHAASIPGTVWLTYREPLVDAFISSSGFVPLKEKAIGDTCLVWSWEQDRRALSSEVVKELLNNAEQWGLLDYAFAFSGYSRKCPQAEAISSPFTDKLSTSWDGMTSCQSYSAKQLYESGLNKLDFLREIYPYQILSPIHLSYRIGKLTLENWIKSSDSHGTLSEFSQEHWLWEIPKKQLPAVRQALIENNLLTLYLPDMSRILEDYGNPDK